MRKFNSPNFNSVRHMVRVRVRDRVRVSRVRVSRVRVSMVSVRG